MNRSYRREYSITGRNDKNVTLKKIQTVVYYRTT